MTEKQVEKKIKALETKIVNLEKRIDAIENWEEEEEGIDDSHEWLICIRDTKCKPGMKCKPLPTLYYSDQDDWIPAKMNACRYTLAGAQKEVAGFDFLPR